VGVVEKAIDRSRREANSTGGCAFDRKSMWV